MSFDQKAIMQLENLVKCPVDWVRNTRQSDAGISILVFDWWYCWRVLAATHHEDLDDFVDPEQEDLIAGLLSDNGADTLERLTKDISARQSRAQQHYLSRSGKLSGLNFLGPSVHGKHFRRELHRDASIRASSKGASLFFEDESVRTLETIFWSWFFRYFMPVWTYDDYVEMIEHPRVRDTEHGRLWETIIGESSARSGFRIVTDCGRQVGASRGKPTNLLCFDIHTGAKTAHAFPIDVDDCRRVLDGKSLGIADELEI